MTTNMHSKLLKAYLNGVCETLDRGEKVSRPKGGWMRAGLAATFVAGLALGAGGCGSDGEGTPADSTSDDALVDGADLEAKADGVSQPLGSYENQGTTGDFEWLVMRASDSGFTAKKMNGGEVDGTWKFTKVNTTRYVHLTTDGVDAKYEYKYSAANKTLTLRKSKTAGWFTMAKVAEVCDDGADNDHDGAVDCADVDCHSSCGLKYMGPIETKCADGLDNDGDGVADCDDPDCNGYVGCHAMRYMGPMPEGICNDGIDNDGDGKTDCADSDCANTVTCTGMKYMGPVESVCDDGSDNDKDGNADCADSDCYMATNCQGTRYMGPVETNCQDETDNDNDGLTDCLDSDCTGVPPCMGMLYAAPGI
jgi:hypothetical protein